MPDRYRVMSAVFLGLLSAPVAAAPPDPSLFQHLAWRSIGPFRGGRVLAVEGAPDRPERFYFGSVNGGIWRTDDSGRTWQPIFDQAPVGSIGALAVAPSDPARIYAGTGEADMRSDIAQGVGMFRSDDGGAHWQTLGLEDSQAIARILIDPRNADGLLVAVLGHPYGPNETRGVFRSDDGGRHWTRVLFRDADTGAIDLAASPVDPKRVYAALWQTRRPPWSVYPPSNGPGSGVFVSADGGRHFTELLGHGLPSDPGRIGLATTPAAPHRVFALISTRSGKAAGLYRSDDDGATWRLLSEDSRITERGWYFSGITADPADGNLVYVCNTIMLRSEDGGAHFSALKGDPTGDDFHMLWIDRHRPARRILGVDQGAIVSVNGGATWSSWFNQPTGQFYHVATDDRFPYRVYGAQQDSGAASVASRTDNLFDGISMSDFHESAAGGESDNIAPDPADPDLVYGGRVDRLDLRSNQLRNLDPTLAFPGAYRATWTLPLVWDKPRHVLYFGNQRIFRTRNGGETWQTFSPDLTRVAPVDPPNLDAATRADVTGKGKRRGVVYAIGPSALKAGLVWAGTDDGLIWRTDDDGKHWRDVTPPAMPAWSKVGVVEPSHFDARVAYAAIDRHRLDDFTPHVLRTRDGGSNWTDISHGLGDGGVLNAVNVVREDPVVPGLLFAGTERGTFVSFDDGGTWQALQRGLPRTSVRDIEVKGSDLVIATHGRGFYILDDMSALREIATHVPSAPMLLPTAPAIRVHPPAFTGTPLPRDEPLAMNPPNGAMIDYVLPTGVRDVAIDILDESGQTLRHFDAAAEPPAPDPGKITTAPEWIAPPPRVATGPGSHRLTWDLRLVQDALLAGSDDLQPIQVPPGRYTVVLRANGQVVKRDLTVLPDPRVNVSRDALQATYALCRQVEALRLSIRRTIRDAQAASARNADVARLIGAPRDGENGAPADPNGLTGISARLDKLAYTLGSADAAPSPDALSGWRMAQADAARALGRWETLRARAH